jgi:hypothetical protein
MEPEDVEPIDPADELMFLCLGGGNEVGRSCHILQYKGKTVMVRITKFLAGVQHANLTSSTLVCTLRMKVFQLCPFTMTLISAQ